MSTFNVDHHGKSTDPMMVWDEVSKCAYRANKAWELVAATEIAELRRENAALRQQGEAGLRAALTKLRDDAVALGDRCEGAIGAQWAAAVLFCRKHLIAELNAMLSTPPASPKSEQGEGDGGAQ